MLRSGVLGDGVLFVVEETGHGGGGVLMFCMSQFVRSFIDHVS